MAEIAARAGIHRCYELKCSGKIGALIGAHHADPSRFQWLTQSFQHAAIELRQLIQEQHAMVGQADLTWAGVDAAAADQRRQGGGVVRLA